MDWYGPARTGQQQLPRWLPTQRLQRRVPRHCIRSAEQPNKETVVPGNEPASPSASPSPVLNTSPQPAAGSEASGKGLLAAAAVGLGAAAFVISRLALGGPSFASMEAASIPLDEALANGKPTVVEFYAGWCEVCRELVPAAYDVETRYQGKVNYVMLNVDNTLWRPEVLEYGVQGIPHFVFLDSKGQAQAAAVGRLPKEILEEGAAALAEGRKVPFARVVEETSPLTPPDSMQAPKRTTGPLDHS